MSKAWPDPYNDKGKDFWDFENMVNEYDYEMQAEKKKPKRDFSVAKAASLLGLLIGAIFVGRIEPTVSCIMVGIMIAIAVH